MSFYSELDPLNLEKLIGYFQDIPFDGEDDPFLYYSEVALLISEKGKAGISFLQSQIDKADTARLVAILFSLAEPLQEDRKFRDLLVSYLEDKRPMVVAQAIDSLGKIGAKDIEEQILALREHPSPYVRGSVLRSMTRLDEDKAFPLLIDALKDPDFIVQENAADELGELGLSEAIPYLRSSLEDTCADVRQAAEMVIAFLQG